MCEIKSVIKTYSLTLVLVSTLLLYSCSRRHHPAQTPSAMDENNVAIGTPKKTDSVVVKKVVIKPKIKTPVPKVIVVNDVAAHKSIDGRLYYDLEGHRYWKNYKNGKYYLFNQSMYNNAAFKAPEK